LNVLPADFDFGIVTDGNSLAPLEVTIQNDGTADLVVSGITLTDTVNFVLDVNGGGVNACGTTAPTIPAGGSCTVEVEFLPQDVNLPAGGIDYSASLTIQSNDPTTPTFDLGLTGKRQDIIDIQVKINQIDACPRVVGTPVKAYVSVIDQAGFPVTTLDENDFTLTEKGATIGSPDATAFVNNVVSLSVTLLMDYSFSITQEPDNVADMEKAATNFIEQLGTNDEAEIIKYATTIEVTRPFTSDKDLLIAAINSTPNVGAQTRFYDSIVRAVNNLSTRTKDRKAIIIITDGEDNNGNDEPLSTNDLDDVIAKANLDGVPVFTVGLGDRVDPDILGQLAGDTGGTFSPSTTSDNLATIYHQLATLLFSDQYILTYETTLEENETGTLGVTANYPGGISKTDTKVTPICQ
jgi:Ca-activated chloride channel family protein